MPWIKKDDCKGCMVCATVCPVEAITVENGSAVIDQLLCTKCGACVDACSFEAIRPNYENPELRGGHNHQYGGGRHYHGH